MRSLMVVELPPGLDEHYGFAEADKPLTMQACIPQLAVTALKRAILPGAAGLYVSGPDVVIAQPAHLRCRGEFKRCCPSVYKPACRTRRIRRDNIRMTAWLRIKRPTSRAKHARVSASRMRPRCSAQLRPSGRKRSCKTEPYTPARH